MNTQPRHPKCRALPVELHPDIQFLLLYHSGEENQNFFCLWSFMWSKPILYRFRQSWKVPQTQASQGFAAFHLALSRIPPRHPQTRRDTNFAIPGYSVFCHDTTAERKNKDFLSVVILHFSHPTMPRGKKQQEAGDFLPAFCCFFASFSHC